MTAIFKSAAGAQAVEARYRAFLARWPVPNTQFHVPTREGDTFVVASGSEQAPPLVLLHGTASTSFAWMGDIAIWAQAFRVYAVDVIGEPGLSAPARPALDSDAHALWLADVFTALGLDRAALLGVSFGGWLALDFATRHPARVSALVVLSPGGVGANKNILLWALPLLLLGPWGRRKLSRTIAGPTPANAPPMPAAVGEFLALIFRHFQVRRAPLPIFSDAALQRLTMPALAIVGGKDVTIDSMETQHRLEANLPRVEARVLPDAGHAIRGQTAAIAEFLRRAVAG